jgi:glycosidase
MKHMQLTKKWLQLGIYTFLSINTFAQVDPIATQKEWYAQSNIYEVNLRQYTPEGTFQAFEKELPRLRKMGVEIIWFMPITPIGIEGRKMTAKDLGSYYSVRDYKNVNPEFGNITDFKRLVQRMHYYGFKVIIDWVANHSAIDNPWTKQHPDFYKYDSTGKLLSPFDWTDVAKLNYDNKALWDTMTNAMKFWVEEAEIDGFRCDVAEEVTNDFWKYCIEKLKKTRADLFFLAEGNKPDLHLVGFDETYQWSAMHSMKDFYTGKINLSDFVKELEKEDKKYPANAFRLFFTSNHDENSWNGTEYEKFGPAAANLSILSQTYRKSLPLVYSGQEAPLKKRLRFFTKDTIEWNNFQLQNFYTTLLRTRRLNKALSASADQVFIKTTSSDQILSYARIKGNDKVVVLLNMSDKPAEFSVKSDEYNGNYKDIFSRKKVIFNQKEKRKLGAWEYLVLEKLPK